MSENTTIKIDSSQARADLAALAKSLDQTGKAYAKMESGIAAGTDKTNAALVKAAKNMESFARVASTVSKIKLSGDPAKALNEFASALNALSRVREIKPQTLQGFSKFLQVGVQAQKINFGSGSFSGLMAFSNAMNAVAATRTINSAKLKSFVDFIEVAARTSKIRMSGQATQSLEAFARAMSAIAATKSISPQRIAALKELFNVLATAKGFPNANAIARDLDHIASAAVRAGAALNGLPTRMRGIGAMLNGSAAGARNLNNSLKDTPARAAAANKGVISLGNSLNGLSARFKLSYQAGTLFSAMFSAFTFGQFVKGVYDTSVSFMKLEKAMYFVTGSFSGATKATEDYIALSFQLGMNVEKNAEAYSRFAISSRAIGAELKDINQIYKGTVMALQAVGASPQQAEYAFYGLSQAMAKGKVTSEEFNRQIGEQIPGNVAAGVAALKRLGYQGATAATLFDMMRKGAIQSLPFLKAWSEELVDMYEKLLPLAAKRPDFQLSRLQTAFSLFKREVGRSEFIGALTNQLARLADKFVVVKDGVATLTPQAQKLANSLGKGLADLVRGAGAAIEFVADNIDGIVMSLKGLAAFGLAAMLTQWSKGFTIFADKIMAATFATKALTQATIAQGAAEAVANPVSSSRMASAVSRVKGEAGGGNLIGTIPMRSKPGFGKQADLFPDQSYVTQFGRRAPAHAPSPAALGLAPAMAAGAGAAGATKAAGGFSKMLAVLPGLGMLAGAAAIALAVFGNSLSGVTSAAGNAATYNDIAAASFDNMMDRVSNWFTQIIKGWTGVEDASLTMGRTVAAIGAAIETVFGGLFSIASLLGKTIGTVIASLMFDVLMFAKAADQARKGKFGDAWKTFTTDRGEGKKAMFEGLGEEFKAAFGQDSVFNVRRNFEKNLAGAGERADKRAGDVSAAKEANAAAAILDATTAQQKAADATAIAASDLADATSNFKQLTDPLKFEDLMKRIVALGQPAAKREAMAAPGTRPRTYESLIAESKATSARLVDPSANISLAKSMEGMTETGNRQFLQEFFKRGNAQVDPKMTAWCAAFVNAVLATNGLPTTGNNLARSFMNYGEEAKDPQVGDLVVLKRGNSNWQGHVGFYQGKDERGNVRVLGGNQGNGVNTSSFKASDVLGYRRIPGTGEATAGTGINGASSGMGGAMDMPMTEDEAETKFARRANAMKSMQGLMGLANPGADALADQQRWLEGLRDIIVAEEKLKDEVGTGFTSLFDASRIDALTASHDKLTDKIIDGINPLGKETRLMEQANDIAGMRMKGLSEEADWRERMNELDAQGYNVSLMEDKVKWQEHLNALNLEGLGIDMERLSMDKESWLAAKRRTDVLSTQADLIRSTNDNIVSKVSRQGDSYQTTLAGLVNSQAKPGETYAQASDRLSRPDADGKIAMDNLQQQAGVLETQRRDDVSFYQNADLKEMMSTRGLNGADRGRREDYKTILAQITNSTSSFLGDIEGAATEADKAWAKYYADMKYAAEHPPGFERWVQGLEPFAERMEQIKVSFAESLSNGITDALMGDKVDWGSMMKDISRQWVKAMVDDQLAGLFGKKQKPEEIMQVAANDNITAGDKMLEAAYINREAAAMMAGGTGAVGADGLPLPNLGGAGGGIGAADFMSSITGGGAGAAADPIGALIAANSSGGAAAGGGGFFSKLMGGIGSMFGGGKTGGAAGGGGGIMGAIGSIMGGGKTGGGGLMGLFGKGGKSGGLMGMLGAGGMLYNLFKKDKPEVEAPAPSMSDINGIIGTMSTHEMSGTAIAARENPWAQVANMALSAFTGNFGMGGGMSLGKTLGNMGGAMSGNMGKAGNFLAGLFEEGGYATQPTSSKVMHPAAWANAPHYKNGTANTSGGMPAILHPNEAVIPLSGGRKIPVEMGDQPATNVAGNVTTNITIVAADPNSFRSSRGATQRQMNRDQRRAQARNAAG